MQTKFSIGDVMIMEPLLMLLASGGTALVWPPSDSPLVLRGADLHPNRALLGHAGDQLVRLGAVDDPGDVAGHE